MERTKKKKCGSESTLRRKKDNEFKKCTQYLTMKRVSNFITDLDETVGKKHKIVGIWRPSFKNTERRVRFCASHAVAISKLDRKMVKNTSVSFHEPFTQLTISATGFWKICARYLYTKEWNPYKIKTLFLYVSWMEKEYVKFVILVAEWIKSDWFSGSAG